MLLALHHEGVKLDYDSRIAIHFRFPDTFQVLPGRHNVLFTMYESDELPGFFVRALDRADTVIAPSQWCAELFRKHTQTPVYCVPLGINTELFVGIKRPRPKTRPFRWLWVGAHNRRKGWKELSDAWVYKGSNGAFCDNPAVELYMKTTDDKKALSFRGNNIIIDSRPLEDKELLKVYADADAFVLPSMGEGFGLTLLEAMATALPCVASVHTGMMDFADSSVCRRVQYSPTTMMVQSPIEGVDDFPSVVQAADSRDLYRQMWWVTNHWKKARDMGVRAFRRARQFTWKAAAQRFLHVLEGIEAREKAEGMMVPVERGGIDYGSSCTETCS
jgi:glycosyltransferase involved in cell wall biosynthesis